MRLYQKFIKSLTNFWTDEYKYDLKQKLFKWVHQKQKTSQSVFDVAVEGM